MSVREDERTTPLGGVGTRWIVVEEDGGERSFGLDEEAARRNVAGAAARGAVHRLVRLVPAETSRAPATTMTMNWSLGVLNPCDPPTRRITLDPADYESTIMLDRSAALDLARELVDLALATWPDEGLATAREGLAIVVGRALATPPAFGAVESPSLRAAARATWAAAATAYDAGEPEVAMIAITAAYLAIGARPELRRLACESLYGLLLVAGPDGIPRS